MGDLPWFRHWGKESLASTDIQSLTDHEFRVWWSLMEVASTQPERWVVRLPLPVLARLCGSTTDKLGKALKELAKRGMVDLGPETIIRICNWEKYQDSAEAKRKRRQREEQAGQVTDMSRTRPGTSHGHVTPNVTGEERGEKKEVDLPPNGGSADAVASVPRSRKSSKPLPLTSEERQKLVDDFGRIFPDLDDRILEALNHKALDNAKTEYLYLRGWLRRDAERKSPPPAPSRNGHPVGREEWGGRPYDPEMNGAKLLGRIAK